MTALAVLALGAWATPALGQDMRWMAHFGTPRADFAYALAPDGVGGVMVAGFGNGTPGGSDPRPYDAFVTRYDAQGKQLWDRQFGTSSDDYARALAPDGVGGVMVAGYTEGSLGGASAGTHDAFVARYDADGTQLWIRQFGTITDDRVRALAPDGVGGVMVAGYTFGNLGGTTAGSYDAFVARYDADGTQLWIRQFGTASGDYAYALAPDGVGGVLVAGRTEGSLGGPHIFGIDGFIARYDAEGNQIWIRHFGTSEQDQVFALASDGAGGAMVAGFTYGSLSGANAGSRDAYVARYDADGTLLWIRQFGTRVADEAHALTPDGTGGVLVAGWTGGTLSGTRAGGADAFIARYDADGTLLWIRQFGISDDELAFALASDGSDGVMVAGWIESSPGGSSVGIYDNFVARFVPCYADLDASTGKGTLDIFDFLAFQSAFILGESTACDCDLRSGWLVCDVFDFLCFQDAFVKGCP